MVARSVTSSLLSLFHVISCYEKSISILSSCASSFKCFWEYYFQSKIMANTSLKLLQHSLQTGITTSGMESIFFKRDHSGFFGIKDQNYPKFWDRGSQNMDKNWDHYVMQYLFTTNNFFNSGKNKRPRKPAHSLRILLRR